MIEVESLFKIFWASQSCRNLFLLSKEELLDVTRIKHEKQESVIYSPRILFKTITEKSLH